MDVNDLACEEQEKKFTHFEAAMRISISFQQVVSYFLRNDSNEYGTFFPISCW